MEWEHSNMGNVQTSADLAAWSNHSNRGGRGIPPEEVTNEYPQFSAFGPRAASAPAR
jgi:hypothetical protein